MAEETKKKQTQKKRSKKDPALAAAHTAANKRRNLATQARRQVAKRKKLERWGARHGVTRCADIRKAVRTSIAASF